MKIKIKPINKKQTTNFMQTLQEFAEKPFTNINIWLGTLNINEKQTFVIFLQQPSTINNIIRLPLHTTSTKEAMQILRQIRHIIETLTITTTISTENYRSTR